MTFEATLAATFFLFTGTIASAANPLCVTINQPGKWNGGLVLRFVDNADGTATAFLASVDMFRGVAKTSHSSGVQLASITPITKTDLGGGAVKYSSAAASGLTATLEAPDANGNMQAQIDLQLGDLSLTAKSASLTRFQGDSKCE